MQDFRLKKRMKLNNFSFATNVFRKKLVYFLTLDCLFFFSVFAFMVLVRQKMKSFILEIQSYSAQVALAQQALQEGVGDIDSLLTPLEGVAQESFVFLTFVVPFVFFVLWYIFECPTFLLASSQRIFRERRAWLNMLFINATFFAILFFVLERALDLVYSLFFESFSQMGIILLSVLAFFSFVLTYFVFVLNSVAQSRCSFWVFAKNAFLLAVKKFFRLILVFLLACFLCYLVFIVLFVSFLTFFSTNSYPALSIGLMFSLAFIVMFGWSKVLFIIKVQKEKI